MTDEETDATPDVVEALPPRTERTQDSDWGSYHRPVRPPILSPQEIRRLAFDRGRFMWAVLAIVVWSLGASRLFSHYAIEPFVEDPNAQRELSWLAALSIHLPAAFFAYRMQAPTNRPRLAAVLLAALVCAPFLKYVVVFFLMRDSRQTLRRHGIRTGLLKTEHGSLPGPSLPFRG